MATTCKSAEVKTKEYRDFCIELENQLPEDRYNFMILNSKHENSIIRNHVSVFLMCKQDDIYISKIIYNYFNDILSSNSK